MGVSLLLCLLPALLATASAQDITCQKCSAQGTTCTTTTDPATECQVPKATGGCIIIAEESTLEGISSSQGFSRGCIADFNAGLKEALTFTAGPGWYVRINTKRCKDTDKCNSAALEMPTENITPNGLQCPTCFAVGKKSCAPVTIPCTGTETFCASFAGEITKGTLKKQFAAQGCATPSSKSITDGSTLVSATYTFNFETAKSQDAEKVPSPPAQPSPQPCTQSTSKTTLATTSGASPAPGQVPFALFLPGLTGLLLVKLLS